jgi:alpha-ketoglutarate-dependent 2,4-dichlorophenoxyacetate dioxygenase
MVHHTVRASRRKVGFTDFSGWETSDTNVALAGAVHPLVRTHAGSGRKALYMGAHAESIVGMPLDEGEALLTKLCEMTTIKDAVYSHEWQLHDLVLWDNGCTMHRALPYDDTQRRELRHCMSLELEPVY